MHAICAYKANGLNGNLLTPIQRLYLLEITRGLQQPKEDLLTKTRFNRVSKTHKTIFYIILIFEVCRQSLLEF